MRERVLQRGLWRRDSLSPVIVTRLKRNAFDAAIVRGLTGMEGNGHPKGFVCERLNRTRR